MENRKEKIERLKEECDEIYCHIMDYMQDFEGPAVMSALVAISATSLKSLPDPDYGFELFSKQVKRHLKDHKH